MLAKRRAIKIDGAEIERTPLLVPSFSSKGFPEVAKIIETTEQVIEGATLVSAYDLYHKKIKPPFDFASLVFLDSGGYEASRDTDLSELGDYEHKADTWTRDMHEGVISTWTSTAPTVFISYDHPLERLPVSQQIERAKNTIMPPIQAGVCREILLKPETPKQTLLKLDSVLPHAAELAQFDVVGVTEKEIGNSILSRMENIAQLRKALDRERPGIPIHVFGSLDTITTPMYFLAGADIFDGLTWLRFAYHDGYTMYKNNYSVVGLGINTKAHIVDGHCWFNNYRYLVALQLEMRRFLNNSDFRCFGRHADLFEKAYGNLVEIVGA